MPVLCLRLLLCMSLSCILLFSQPSRENEESQALSHGVDLANKGDLNGALDWFNKALAFARASGSKTGEAQAQFNIGLLYSDQGNYPEALKHLEGAFALFRGLNDREGLGRTVVRTGEVYKSAGQRAKAVAYEMEALPLLEGGMKALVLDSLELMARDGGDLDRALALIAEAIPIYRTAQDRTHEANDLSLQGSYQMELGRYQDALKSLRSALTIWREIKTYRDREAMDLNEIGAVLDSLGEPWEALGSYDKARSIYRDLGDKKAEATANGIIAGFFNRMSDHARALGYYEAAARLWHETPDAHHEAEARRDIGSTLFYMGEISKAIESFQTALAYFRQSGDESEEAEALTFLGMAYRNAGDLSMGISSSEQAENLWSKLDSPLEHINVLSSLALSYIEAGQVAKAVGVLARIEEIAVQTRLRPLERELAWEMSSLVAQSLHRYDLALANSQKALDLAQSMGSESLQAQNLNSIGKIHEWNHKLEDALLAYRASIAISERIRGRARTPELKTSASEENADAYQHAVMLLVRMGKTREAFELTERARARTFLDELGSTRVAERHGSSPLVSKEQDLRQEIANLDGRIRQKSAGEDASVLELREQLAVKQHEYADVLLRLKLAAPEFNSLVTVDPLTLPQVQQRLRPQVTLLSYIVTPEKSAVFVITRDSFMARELAIGETALNASVQNKAYRELYESLIAPIHAELKTSLVALLPNGPLNRLSFTGLSEGGQRTFGDLFTLFYLPSASSLQFLPHSRPVAHPSVLAAANADAGKEFPFLTGANSEAAAIAKMYGAEPTLNITETAFRVMAPQANIIHMAAHGELAAANPLFSRILLAPDGQNDGSLQAREIYGLDLRHADLVTLSACETAKGKASPTDDLQSLSRAFFFAGAPTVVASLWRVKDAAAAAVMVAFYHHLREGKTKAESLQLAQREVRARFPDPNDWAAFILAGRPGGDE